MTELSYVHGASDKPLIGDTIGQLFDSACAQYSEPVSYTHLTLPTNREV